MIDQINIYQASRLAMKMALELLSPTPDFVLVDAVPLDIPQPQQALIHGDARCHAIAAASIVAKVYRDEMMRKWDVVFPRIRSGAKQRLPCAGTYPGAARIRPDAPPSHELRSGA